ncbi:MAG: hypothetical protein ACXWLH_02555 [Candidatus Saccharimonadales bacterium]
MEEYTQLGIVTGEELEVHKQELAAKEAALENPDTKIASYFIAKYMNDSEPVATIGRKSRDKATAAPTPPASPEAGSENEPEILSIVVDATGHRISINGQVLSLFRKKHVAKNKLDESKIAESRLAVIEFMAEHPNQRFSSKQLWEAVFPGTKYESTKSTEIGHWIRDYANFFRNELTHDGQQIITVTKPSIQAKRTYFELTNFSLSISRSDEEMIAENEGMYILPNGVSVGGRVGKLLHLLTKASPESPVTAKETKNIYTYRELRGLKNDRGGVFRSLISTVRQTLQIAGVTNMEVKGTPVGRKNKSTGRYNLGYYLEVGEYIEPVKVEEITDVEDVDSLLSVRDAAIMAAHLDMYKEILAAEGIDPIPDELLASLVNSVDKGERGQNHSSEEEIRQLRADILGRVKRILSNDEALNAMVSALDKDDPRVDLLVHLMNTEVEKRWSILDQIVDARIEQTYSVENGRQKGQGIVSAETKVILPNGEKVAEGKPETSAKPVAKTAKKTSPTAVKKAKPAAKKASAGNAKKANPNPVKKRASGASKTAKRGGVRRIK